MVKKHLKRHATPRSWPIKRKGITFIARPNPGAHPFNRGITINLLLKNLGHAKTTKEVKKVLETKEILVDGKRVKDHKHIIGFMDVMNIPSINKAYRVMLREDGKIDAVEVDTKESLVKPCKITNKTLLKGGKMQLNLFDGNNIIAEKGDFKVGDTVLIEFPKKSIKEHIKLEKGAFIVLTAGKHVADTGVIEDIQGTQVIYKNSNDKTLTTMKDYAFAVGKGKSTVTINKK